MTSQIFGEVDKEKMELIAVLLMGFPNWNHNKNQKEITFASKAYYMALSDVPVEILHNAIKRVTKTQQFLPTPKEIREAVISLILENKPKITTIAGQIAKIATIEGYRTEVNYLSLLTKEYAWRIITSQTEKQAYLNKYLDDQEGELGELYEEWRTAACLP